MSDERLAHVACPHCGQHVEYPADADLASALCPTCCKPLAAPPSPVPERTDKTAPAVPAAAALVKCECNHCPCILEFDPALAASTVTCPHCGMETVLYIPLVPARPPTAPKPEPKRASIVETTKPPDPSVKDTIRLARDRGSHSDGARQLSDQLANVGDWLLGGAIVGGIIALICTLQNLSENRAQTAGIWFVVGLFAVGQGLVIRLLFRAGGAVILLLAERTFTGTITQPAVQRSYKCSLCDAAAQPAQARCSRCDAEFSLESRLNSTAALAEEMGVK